MNTKFINNLIIFLMLTLLAVSAFFIRLENVKRPDIRTVDELVFYRMAQQVNKNAFDYNTIPYGQELSKSGRELPQYFFDPIFKHPPVFTYLVALSMRLFGDNIVTAGYVSLLLSALMIPLIFLLGSLAYNRVVGLTAALFLWLDPVNIICSQKVWMDTTIAFFTLLAAVCFSLGLKKNNWWFFILSGISSGLAVNTKYTGIFITFAILFFAVVYRRDLFKSKAFRISLILPFLMLIPWILWNLSVYNINTFMHLGEFKNVVAMFSGNLGLVIMISLFVVSVFRLYKKVMNDIKKDTPALEAAADTDSGDNPLLRYISFGVVIVVFAVFINKHFLNSLIYNYLPSVSWQQGLFVGEPPSFYFSRLLEFFFVYAFAYVSLFLYHSREDDQNAFLRITSMIIFLFFILWSNYQSRYILSATPFLLLLAANMIYKMYHGFSKIKYPVIRAPLKAFLILIICYSIARVCYVDVFLSYPHNMCYF